MDMIKLPFSGDKRKHRKPDIRHNLAAVTIELKGGK